MKKSDTYTSGFLKSEALQTPSGAYTVLDLTISQKIRTHNFEDGSDQRVLGFREDERELGLNSTNWDSIAEISGQLDDERWEGTRIQLYVDENVRFRGKICPAIRIRRPSGPGPAVTPRQAPPPPPASGNRPPPPPVSTGIAATKAALGIPPWSKDRAWDIWCESSGNAPDMGLWHAAIAGVGKPEDSFGSEDWRAVADKATPF